VAGGLLGRRISRGLPYHFDHRRSRVLIWQTFDPVRDFGSPVKGELCGMEIYQEMRKRRSRETDAP